MRPGQNPGRLPHASLLSRQWRPIDRPTGRIYHYHHFHHGILMGPCKHFTSTTTTSSSLQQVASITKKKKKKKGLPRAGVAKGLFFCIRFRSLSDFLIHRHFPGAGQEGQQVFKIEEEKSLSCLEDCFLFSNKRQNILCNS